MCLISCNHKKYCKFVIVSTIFDEKYIVLKIITTMIEFLFPKVIFANECELNLMKILRSIMVIKVDAPFLSLAHIIASLIPK